MGDRNYCLAKILDVGRCTEEKRHMVEEIRQLRARVKELEELLGRAVKYAREDRAVTPGVTRLARVLAEAETALKR
jgi:predicted  nucleic acid-binding Zn-ribbon protein